MREIVLDTETTGLDPAASHKLVEIAGVELMHHVRTGRHFHAYINPQRDMPAEAFRIHGLSAEFLNKFPVFAHVAQDLLAFIEGTPLVIHNAAFDLKFLNYELRQAGFPSLEGHPVVDTMLLARKKFPGSPANLDALCKRFHIDLSRRTKHGALLDAELLSDVYLEFKGGKQPALQFATSQEKLLETAAPTLKKTRAHRQYPLSPQETLQHRAFLQEIPKALWNDVLDA